jgi:hypothetical protein
MLSYLSETWHMLKKGFVPGEELGNGTVGLLDIWEAREGKCKEVRARMKSERLIRVLDVMV